MCKKFVFSQFLKCINIYFKSASITVLTSLILKTSLLAPGDILKDLQKPQCINRFQKADGVYTSIRILSHNLQRLLLFI
jgi:hypothetical protein